MAELSIDVVDAAVERYAAVPDAALPDPGAGGHRRHDPHHRLAHPRFASNRSDVDTTPDEEGRLLEMFGETPLWGDSLKPFLWTHIDTMIGGFAGETSDRPADHLHL